MRLQLVHFFFGIASALQHSTKGITDLLKRRLPNHIDAFVFKLTHQQQVPIRSSTNVSNDAYTISATEDEKILITGNSPIAIATGSAVLLVNSTTANSVTVYDAI